ncbi:hypothetical protein [Streptomyces sp. NPDC055400]
MQIYDGDHGDPDGGDAAARDRDGLTTPVAAEIPVLPQAAEPAR